MQNSMQFCNWIFYKYLKILLYIEIKYYIGIMKKNSMQFCNWDFYKYLIN